MRTDLVAWLELAAMVPMLAAVLWIESGGLARHGWDGKGRG